MEQDPSTNLPPQRAGVQPPPVPPLRENPVTHPPINPIQPHANMPAAPRVQRRAYPKPPSIFRHIALLCIRPDQWAQAARYPMYVTLIPVIVTVLIISILLSLNAASNAIQNIQTFARNYDRQFAPLVYSKGILSGQAIGDRTLPHFSMPSGDIVVDPAAKTLPESGDKPFDMLFNSTSLSHRFFGTLITNTYKELSQTPLLNSLAPPTDPFTINTAGITAYLQARKWPISIFVGFGEFFSAILSNIAWAFFTAFLVTPFVQLAGQRLAIPYRVAWRIALSITVPLIILDAFLNITNMPLAGTVGAEISSIIWTAMAAGMAIWAGVLANTMYAPPRRTAPRRGM